MLTRDQRLQALTAFEFGHTYSEIAVRLNCTIRQVQYATKHRCTPQKHRCGRHNLFNENDTDLLIGFISRSKANRRIIFLDLSLLFGCFEKAITTAFKSRGYKRHVARRKPLITPKNQAFWFIFAVEYLNWTPEQWGYIL